MGKISDFVRTTFGSRSRKEDVCAEHLIREHHLGRPLSEIMQDAYITNRLSPEQAKRLLDRPDVLHAFGDDLASERAAAEQA